MKIFHISDVHIGMKFQRYPEALRNSLIEARFAAIENAVKMADSENCDVLAITGDIFESIKATKKEVERVCDILKRFNGGAIWVLPGNHDYYDASLQLWKWFEASMPDAVMLFNENKRYDFEIGDQSIEVFAVPCDNKHSAVNHLDWIKELNLGDSGLGDALLGDALLNKRPLRILLAHGAIKDISPDLSNMYYPMTLSELAGLNMDLSLLGHTHVPYPNKWETQSDRIFNAGTPEPDGLNYRYEGSGWLIELSDSGAASAKRMRLGTYQFFDLQLPVSDGFDVETLLKSLEKDRLKVSVVRLNLEGFLDKDVFETRHEVYEKVRRDVAYLEINDDALRAKFTKDTLIENFPEGSLPYRLLETFIEEDDLATAHLAFEIMHEVMQHD